MKGLKIKVNDDHDHTGLLSCQAINSLTYGAISVVLRFVNVESIKYFDVRCVTVMEIRIIKALLSRGNLQISCYLICSPKRELSGCAAKNEAQKNPLTVNPRLPFLSPLHFQRSLHLHGPNEPSFNLAEESQNNKTLKLVNPLLPRVITAKFPCSPRNITPHSLKNLVFHSLLK